MRAQKPISSVGSKTKARQNVSSGLQEIKITPLVTANKKIGLN